MYIVAIGASAGGFEAIWEFFAHLPAKPGVAFVVLMHLHPNHQSISDQLLAKYTSLPIYWATQGQLLQANGIYLLPPNQVMTLQQGQLWLTTRRKDDRQNRAINHFFVSLAKDQQQKAIGIVLSGMGSDGAKGCIAIHQKGGIVLVQAPNSAQFDSMPRMAIYEDDPDFILSPAQLALALTHFLGITAQ